MVTPATVKFDLLDKAIPMLGMLLTLCLLISSCVFTPLASYNVISNTTVSAQCAAQNYAQIVTTRVVSDLQDSVERNANMFKNDVISWHGVSAYTNNSATAYEKSLPAVMMGVLSSTTDIISLGAPERWLCFQH